VNHKHEKKCPNCERLMVRYLHPNYMGLNQYLCGSCNFLLAFSGNLILVAPLDEIKPRRGI